MAELEARRDALRGRLTASEDTGLRLHPDMAGYYRAQIVDLRTALSDPGRNRQAAEIVGKLVNWIELSPVVRSGRKTLSVSLYGRLAGILAMATKANAPLDESDAPIGSQNWLRGPATSTVEDWRSSRAGAQAPPRTRASDPTSVVLSKMIAEILGITR